MEELRKKEDIDFEEKILKSLEEKVEKNEEKVEKNEEEDEF